MSSPSALTQLRNRHASPFVVVLAAAMWGFDGLIRKSVNIPASTLVFAEHVALVVITLPWLWGSLKSARKLDFRGWIYIIVIGAGASAVLIIFFMGRILSWEEKRADMFKFPISFYSLKYLRLNFIFLRSLARRQIFIYLFIVPPLWFIWFFRLPSKSVCDQ